MTHRIFSLLKIRLSVLTGLLNERVLNAFRHTNIRVLSLTESLGAENGLNITGSDVLRGNDCSSHL